MALAVAFIIALALTCTMFATRQAMLGYPSAMFWAVTGGVAYTYSDATWDTYYFIFFAATLGMTIFCVIAAFGLREQKDTGTDEKDFIDESTNIVDDGNHSDDETEPVMSERTRNLRKRAASRRRK